MEDNSWTRKQWTRWKNLNPPISLNLNYKLKSDMKLIENVDPYTLQKEVFTENIDCFPKATYPGIISYFLFAPSPLPKEQLKAYKSLKSHIISCRKQDVGVKLFKNDMLLHGRASYTFFTLFNLYLKFSF